jgi:hypothetical protein
MKNYYEILEVSIYATQEEIKKAYYKQTKKYHPDNNVGKDTTSIFQEINAAYNTLSDASKRKIYDQSLNKTNYQNKYYSYKNSNVYKRNYKEENNKSNSSSEEYKIFCEEYNKYIDLLKKAVTSVYSDLISLGLDMQIYIQKNKLKNICNSENVEPLMVINYILETYKKISFYDYNLCNLILDKDSIIIDFLNNNSTKILVKNDLFVKYLIFVSENYNKNDYSSFYDYYMNHVVKSLVLGPTDNNDRDKVKTKSFRR